MNTDDIVRYPTVLTIAGSDSSGGAGIQADLKTLSALGVYGASVITAVTAQNTQGVRVVQSVSPALLEAQLAAVWDDMRIDAVKIGMLYTREAVEIVERAIDTYHPAWTVLDPILLSTSGHLLLEKEAVQDMVIRLFPRISLLTPNLVEAEYLTGLPVRNDSDQQKAAARLMEMGCPAVLLKGGHGLTEEDEQVIDTLYVAGRPPLTFSAQRIRTLNSHGTGCTLSSAIAAYLAIGYSLEKAVAAAKQYLTDALAAGANVRMGQGHGPLNHFFAPLPLQKIPC